MQPSQQKRRNGPASETIVISGIPTAILSMFVVFVGFLLSKVCIFLFHPECVFQTPSGSWVINPAPASYSQASKPKNKIVSSDPIVLGKRTGAKHPKSSDVIEDSTPDVAATANFPPHCTSEQIDEVAKILPPDGCTQNAKKPWSNAGCGFSEKTMCGNFNPHWFYDYIRPTTEDFRGIMVGCNKGYAAVELLRILSPSSDKKYDLEAWKEEFSKVDGDESVDLDVSCGPSATATTDHGSLDKKLHVYCIEGLPKTVAQLEKTKKALGYGDELDITNLVVLEKEEPDGRKVKSNDPVGFTGGGEKHWSNLCKKKDAICETVPAGPIDQFIESKPGLKAVASDAQTGLHTSPPIHFMSITAEGSDYSVLQGAAQNLGRIQYIDFQYHWNWMWGSYEFKDLIDRLKKKGFVCYFISKDGPNMWRVTDCWQFYYSIKFAASVGCVNANIPEAEPLLNTMEGIFMKNFK